MGDELEAIEATLRTEPAVYWNDQGMQDRYRELLSQERAADPETVDDGNPANEDGSPFLPEPLPQTESYDILTGMGPECSALAAEWDAAGGYGSHLRNVQASVSKVIEGMPVRDQRAFMERFDSLPESVIASVYRELSLGQWNFLPDASDADVGRFASTPAGKQLVEEWGATAPARVALVQSRFSRLVEGMISDRDRSIFLAWFNSLSAKAAKAVLVNVSR